MSVRDFSFPIFYQLFNLCSLQLTMQRWISWKRRTYPNLGRPSSTWSGCRRWCTPSSPRSSNRPSSCVNPETMVQLDLVKWKWPQSSCSCSLKSLTVVYVKKGPALPLLPVPAQALALFPAGWGLPNLPGSFWGACRNLQRSLAVPAGTDWPWVLGGSLDGIVRKWLYGDAVGCSSAVKKCTVICDIMWTWADHVVTSSPWTSMVADMRVWWRNNIIWWKNQDFSPFGKGDGQRGHQHLS